MGALIEYLSSLCLYTTTKTKKRSLQTVEIKVKMDCDGCERKVKNVIRNVKGVKTVEINRKQSRVTVNGCVDPNKVLKSVKKTGKRAEFWPYIPYNVVQYPHSTYDKRAPAGYVKNVQQVSAPVETITYLFNDDNTDGCTIM